MPPALAFYLALTHVLGPAYRLLLQRRLKQGKESPSRIAERQGIASMPRPEGPLIWFHAASVGEAHALLSLVRRLLDSQPQLNVLMTTTTLTSADLMASSLPERAFHQFMPVDTAQATRRFLSHWSPSLAVWTESELWPRMMSETRRAAVPMLLINARVSPKTAATWRRWPKTVASLLSYFDRIATQDQQTANLMAEIGVAKTRLTVTGSTKAQAARLPANDAELARLRAAIADRPCWVAASTHPGEEEIILSAHRDLTTADRDTLLLLIPRHPDRGNEVLALCRKAGLAAGLRSQGALPEPEMSVYVADTMGEMGLWYRLSEISFVGGSLVPIGGHNPYEPAVLGSAIISGPQVFNFQDIYARLEQSSGVTFCQDAASLSAAVTDLSDRDARKRQIAAADGVISKDRDAMSIVSEWLTSRL